MNTDKKISKTEPAWHKQVAAELEREFAATNELNETARRRRARLGLMLIWVKEAGKADGSIPHGKFGNWMKEHLPAIPPGTTGDYITEANSICDLLKWQNSEIPKFDTPPHKLLAAKSDDLTGVEVQRQSKLFDIIDQRKHFRAITKYAQTEIKDDATVAKKGRRKGEGGASREQRAAHRMAMQQADLKGRKAMIKNLGDCCDDAANDQAIGDPECAAEFEAALPKIENLYRYMKRVNDERKKKL